MHLIVGAAGGVAAVGRARAGLEHEFKLYAGVHEVGADADLRARKKGRNGAKKKRRGVCCVQGAHAGGKNMPYCGAPLVIMPITSE